MKENFFNQVKKETAKAVTVGAITIASMLPGKEVGAQSSNFVNKDHIVRVDLKENINYNPATTWKFEEDSVLATNESKTYPGFVENYIKNEKGDYYFYGYKNKQGDPINTPEYIQNNIDSLKNELVEYTNPDWAKQQFEYQKTKKFEQEVVGKYIFKAKQYISDIKDKIDLLKDNIDYSKSEREYDIKDLNRWQESLDNTERDPSWIIKERKRSLDQLEKDVKGYVYLFKMDLIRYEEELSNVLKYIESQKN